MPEGMKEALNRYSAGRWSELSLGFIVERLTDAHERKVQMVNAQVSAIVIPAEVGI